MWGEGTIWLKVSNENYTGEGDLYGMRLNNWTISFLCLKPKHLKKMLCQKISDYYYKSNRTNLRDISEHKLQILTQIKLLNFPEKTQSIWPALVSFNFYCWRKLNLFQFQTKWEITRCHLDFGVIGTAILKFSFLLHANFNI